MEPQSWRQRGVLQLQSLLALALALGALRWLPPVPVVAVADVAVVHLHLDARGDDGGSCEAVGTIFADRTTLLWFIDRVDTLGNCAVCYNTVNFIAGLAATPFAWRGLKFLQYFVIFSVIFTKVFHFLAFRTASIVLHFCTLWVDFRAFGLITNRSILSTNAGTVGMPREKPFSQFVHKATVIHATLPSVVIKDQIVIAGGLVPFISRVVFVVDGSRCDQARDYKQQYPGFMDVKSHPPPQLLHGISGPDRNSCFHKETSVVV